MPFHNKEASRYKVCIQNATVFFLGFASQMVPYTFYLFIYFFIYLFIYK